MRYLALILLLAGCSSKSELPKQPDAPTDGVSVKEVGKDIDARSNKVAAAVTVVKENADKPHIVSAEAGVALGFLPTPSDGELAIARQRVAKADPKEYQSAAEQGKKLLAKINADLSNALAAQAEAKRVSDLKDKRIADLEQEVIQVKQDASKNVWTITGAALVVIGGLACAFASVRIGIPILLAGAFAGAVPFIYDSPYFNYIAAFTLLACAGLGIWWLWDKVRDAVNRR